MKATLSTTSQQWLMPGWEYLKYLFKGFSSSEEAVSTAPSAVESLFQETSSKEKYEAAAMVLYSCAHDLARKGDNYWLKKYGNPQTSALRLEEYEQISNTSLLLLPGNKEEIAGCCLVTLAPSLIDEEVEVLFKARRELGLPVPQKEAFLMKVAIHPSYQGKGKLPELIAEAVSSALASNCSALSLYVVPHRIEVLCPLYNKTGFSAVLSDAPGVLMTRLLPKNS